MSTSRDANTRNITRQEYRQGVEGFWDSRAHEIHVRWSQEKDDFHLFSEWLAHSKPRRLLDLGCGYGRLFPLYHEIDEVHGVDVSSSMLALVRDLPPNVTLHTARFWDLPFPDGYFDVVLSSRALAHVAPEDLDRVLASIERVCAGHVLLLEKIRVTLGEGFEFAHSYEAEFRRFSFRMVDEVHPDDESAFQVHRREESACQP